MADDTEKARKAKMAEINAEPGSREALEAKHGEVYDTQEMQAKFESLGFMAPYVVVKRRSDGVKGSLEFQASPRFYYGFKADK